MSHVKSINIEALTSAKSEMAKILNTRALNVADVSRVMSLAFGGTDAAGAWDWRMGFDVMQAAALEIARARLGSASDAQTGLSVVERIAASLPTETRRTERQMQLQQFTTAMPWGWIVAKQPILKRGMLFWSRLQERAVWPPLRRRRDHRGPAAHQS